MTRSACYSDLSGCCVENRLNEDGVGGQDWKLQEPLVEGGCNGAWDMVVAGPKEWRQGSRKVGGFQRCLAGGINRAL